MKTTLIMLRRFLPLACLAIPACAPIGIMTYKTTEVTGRPYFGNDGSMTTMQIVDVSRPKDETIWWNDRVLNHQSIDTSRHYRFELEEGTAVYNRGADYGRAIAKDTDVYRVYDDQNLIYDASFCRLHSQTMPRTNREDSVDAESLPSGYDKASAQLFPNSRFDHPACSSMSAYSSLDWTCPQCSDAESAWLTKNSKLTKQ